MLAFLFLSILFLCLAVYMYVLPPRTLQDIFEPERHKKEKVSRHSFQLQLKPSAFKNIRYFQKHSKNALARGLDISAGEIGLKTFLVTAGVFIVGLVLFRHSLLAGISAIIALIFVPKAIITFSINRMESIITKQIARVVFSLSSTVRAGNTLLTAIKTAGEDVPPPLGPELLRVHYSVKHGESVELALENLSARTGYHPTVKKLVVAIKTSLRTGGSIAGALDGVAEMVHDRIHTRAMVRSYSMQGFISAASLNIVPIITAFMMNRAIPGLVADFFYGAFTGQLMLFGCVYLILLGWLIIYKVIQQQFSA